MQEHFSDLFGYFCCPANRRYNAFPSPAHKNKKKIKNPKHYKTFVSKVLPFCNASLERITTFFSVISTNAGDT